MKLSKQDRNTAITILIVLVICTVSLIAIGSFLWRLISPGVSNATQVLGLRASSLNTDYNFAIAGYEFAEQEIANEETLDLISAEQNSGYNYNFYLPKKTN